MVAYLVLNVCSGRDRLPVLFKADTYLRQARAEHSIVRNSSIGFIFLMIRVVAISLTIYNVKSTVLYITFVLFFFFSDNNNNVYLYIYERYCRRII